jgi:reductive dehalogenase
MGNHDYKSLLNSKHQLGPYPMERLKRVDSPTTKITDSIQRFDWREHGFSRARRGDFGQFVASEMSRFASKDAISRTLKDVIPPLTTLVDGEAAPTMAPIPEDPRVLSNHIKSMGYFLRADIVGICQLPQYAVYSHDANGDPVECNHKYAILLVIDQGYQTMNGSTGIDWISNSQSQQGYSTAAFVSSLMADYIRRLGYSARAQCTGSYQVLITPLLLQAGIGELSRAGIVLNPFLGLRFKAAAVTTDLPLMPDKPVDFGLKEFCRKCVKCAVECPSHAISMADTVMHNGYEKWEFNADQCAKFRVTNQKGAVCGRCIKVCPWNKPKGWTHGTVRWMVKNTPFLDGFLVKMHDIWGYGKQNSVDKWWFDLEYLDGKLSTPKNKSDKPG